MNELFRYRKDDRARTYALRAIGEHASELWVTASVRGRVTGTRKLAVLAGTDDTRLFLESVEQELRAGGWARSG